MPVSAIWMGELREGARAWATYPHPDLLASFVVGNRCPVVREDASWAVVLLVSLVVQDSVSRRLLYTRAVVLLAFLPLL